MPVGLEAPGGAMMLTSSRRILLALAAAFALALAASCVYMPFDDGWDHEHYNGGFFYVGWHGLFHCDHGPSDGRGASPNQHGGGRH